MNRKIHILNFFQEKNDKSQGQNLGIRLIVRMRILVNTDPVHRSALNARSIWNDLPGRLHSVTFLGFFLLNKYEMGSLYPPLFGFFSSPPFYLWC